ncbi:MAG: sulfatase-like hydrolase/transferase [Verrucomicrobiales bacterium]|nr:sulfatase-like hydrolase/transferase [Verrucomicrobiales bacterium]
MIFRSGKSSGKFLPSLLTLGLLFGGTVGADEKPNLVFLIADDLGWADVEFHGGNTPTPNLNRLLAEGVELKQHYVAPVCSPTRAGFLTGRYWSRFGITTPINNRGLPFETVTLPKALSEAGYSSALVGKWHLGSKPEWGPNHFGFDHSYGSLAGGIAPYNHRYKKGEYSVTWHRNHELIEEDGHVTDLLADEAVKWIGEQDGPFFLYVPFTAVHLPIREPEKWLAKVPAEIKGEVARQYSACILHLDDAIGRIVKAIDDGGHKENTLIIFTSDNGGSTAENNDTKYPDDNCPNGRLPGNNKPFRGRKGTLYEGGIRVPTIARWPGKLQPRSEFNTPVCVVDWMPTFCSLAAAKADGETLEWDGVNLWPALAKGADLPKRAIYIAGPRGKQVALRDGKWKLIHGGNQSQLFDLEADPAESSDLAAKEPEIAAQMQQKLEKNRKADVKSRGGL